MMIINTGHIDLRAVAAGKNDVYVFETDTLGWDICVKQVFGLKIAVLHYKLQKPGLDHQKTGFRRAEFRRIQRFFVLY